MSLNFFVLFSLSNFYKVNKMDLQINKKDRRLAELTNVSSLPFYNQGFSKKVFIYFVYK